MERLEKDRVSELLFAEVVDLARRRGWISDEPFRVDGTLIEAWASLKSFRPKDEPPPPPGGDRNDWVAFQGAEALEPDACLDDGSAGAPGSQGLWLRSETVLWHARGGRESERPAGPAGGPSGRWGEELRGGGSFEWARRTGDAWHWRRQFRSGQGRSHPGVCAGVP